MGKVSLNGGAARSLMASAHSGLFILRFSDIPAGSEGKNGAKERTTAWSRAVCINEISSFLFSYLEEYRIPTHFVKKTSESEMLVRKLRIIPLEVSVRNIADSAYAQRLGVREGSELSFPVIEHRYDRGDAEKPLLNDFHIYSLGLATPDQLRMVNRLAAKTNIVLRSFFERRDLRMISVRLEFGFTDDSSGQERIVLGGEVSPRTCQLMIGAQRERGRSFVPLDLADTGAWIDLRQRIFRTSGEAN